MTMHRATLDRIVDGEHAVLLLEDETSVVDEVVCDVDEVPAEGRHEGACFEVVVDGDGALESCTYLPEETERRQTAAQDRLDRLSSPLGDRGGEDDGDDDRVDDGGSGGS